MARRRTVFATPLVVVLGCSHPPDRITTTPSNVARDDAGTGSPVATAPDDAAFQPCVPSLKRSCNPPAPDARARAQLDRQVVHFVRKDGGIEFVVPTGGEEIVDNWTGVFLGPGGPIAGTEFEIRKATDKQLLCFIAGRTSLPSEQVRVMEPGRD